MRKYIFFVLFLCFSLYGENAVIKKIKVPIPFENWTSDFFTCISENRISLKNSVLYQDEEGRTHYTNIEKIGPGIQAKKVFLLKNPVCEKAKLFAFHATGLNLTCNEVLIKESEKLPSTGWHVWDIPEKLLKKGLNEFVFTGSGTLLIEPSLFPDRSARSIDGGKTWDFDCIGINNGNGEYLVRLRLYQYPEKGIVKSCIYDLLDFADGSIIHGKFVSARKLTLSCKTIIPEGTDIVFQYRCGDSMMYEPEKWSSWENLIKNKNSWLIKKTIHKRFIQFQAILISKTQKVSPSIENIEISGEIEYYPSEKGIRVLEYKKTKFIQTSIPFVYQQPSQRTKMLRTMYKLDDVVKEGKTEFEKFVLLRNWARHTAIKGWDHGISMWCPPWDALIILATNKQPIALCMCTHYSTIFTQCAIALGYTARQVILDHHCVAEVWSNEFEKWILMDTGSSQNPEMNCHLEHNGIPLNALEIRNLWKSGKINEIKFVYANPSSITTEEKEKFEASYFKNFRRFAIPLRNNFLGNPEPGELEQGMSEYYCDMYLWYEDSCETIESPEYGKTSNRISDFYWTLNQTFIDLISEEKDSLIVTLYNDTPSFSHYLIRINGNRWTKTQPQFVWNIKSGKNILEVKSINLYGLECPVSRVVIEK